MTKPQQAALTKTLQKKLPKKSRDEPIANSTNSERCEVRILGDTQGFTHMGTIVSKRAIGKGALVGELRAVRDQLRTWGEPEADVRLAVWRAEDPLGVAVHWQLNWGPSDYDLVHGHYCGASLITADSRVSDLAWVAEDLIREIQDQAA